MMREKRTAATEQTSRQFLHLSQQFTRLLNGRSEGDRQQLNVLFDELNALDFKTAIFMTSAAGVLVINQICTVIPPSDTFLVAKSCQLISNFVMKQEVKVQGKTLDVTVNWIIEALKFCADIALLDILTALSAIFKDNGNNISSIKEILGPTSILITFLNPVKSSNLKLALPWEVHLATLQCLESLSQSSSDDKVTETEYKDSYLEMCKKIFLDHLWYDKATDQDESNFCNILVTSLRGLQNIITRMPKLDQIGDLLGVVQAFMLYGLPGHIGLKPEKVISACAGAGEQQPASSADQGSKKGSKSVKAKKKRKKIVESCRNISQGDGADDSSFQEPSSISSFRLFTTDKHHVTDFKFIPSWLKTSESEFSDVEGGQSAKIRSSHSQIRLAALTLLYFIIKLSEKKVMFGYWFNLLPTGPSMPQTRTLITCLLKDPSPRCRMATLNNITTLLLGSQLYLKQAEVDKKASSSFTPFSITLGYLVTELHRSLCLALIAEHSSAVLSHILKCLAALVQNTPYHRLEHGLITKILRNVRSYLKHKDSRVSVAALTVIGSVASIEPPLAEITEQLSKPAPSKPALVDDEAVGLLPKYPKLDGQAVGELEGSLGDDREYVEEDECVEEETEESSPLPDMTNRMSWLVEHCLENLSDKVRLDSCIPAAVKIESLQVLAVLSRNFFKETIRPHISTVTKTLHFCFSDKDPVIHRHAGHVVKGIGLAMQTKCPNTSQRLMSLDVSVEFWQKMLSGPVTSMIQNPNDATVRTVGCQCLASIGSDVLQELKRDKQILIVTVLFGCCKDVDQNVTGSAIRALGICIHFPVLREDIHFVMDTAEAVIATLKDLSLCVRTKSSWSLGNLSDSLVLNRNANMEDIPEGLLFQLMAACIDASTEHDKVRSNAMRSVGNLLLLYTEEMIAQPKFKKSVDMAINALVHNAMNVNNMKVRWNACYAMKNVLKNSVIYKENQASVTSVYSSLTSLVTNFRNFKVRISAATALATPMTRAMYGSHFIQIWDGLMKGLDNLQNMEDFSEYQHQDNLIDQICATLIHLMTLVTPDDLSPLLDILLLHVENMQKQILRYHLRVVPERESDLITASHHAKSLLQQSRLTPGQRNACSLLVSIFSQDTDFTN